jgi:hypothetical protein
LYQPKSILFDEHLKIEEQGQKINDYHVAGLRLKKTLISSLKAESSPTFSTKPQSSGPPLLPTFNPKARVIRRRKTRACEGLTTEGSPCHIALAVLPKILILS